MYEPNPHRMGGSVLRGLMVQKGVKRNCKEILLKFQGSSHRLILNGRILQRSSFGREKKLMFLSDKMSPLLSQVSYPNWTLCNKILENIQGLLIEPYCLRHYEKSIPQGQPYKIERKHTVLFTMNTEGKSSCF